MDLQTLATVLPTAISATLYTLVQSSFAWTLMRGRAVARPPVRPWVSILKPVAGLDDELRENLESFAVQRYPAFEMLIGIASPSDAAVPVVEAFLAAHPGVSARLVFTAPAGGAVLNPKVAQLLHLTRHARGSVLVVSDANVRVPPHYLDALVGALLRPGVGLVSSLIVGTGERSLGGALENAQLGTAIAPAVVAAHRLFGRPITVGKSMAMRRADLERVGGWAAVADVLAEDDVLGRRFHALGYGVELCLSPVENRNVTCSPRRMLDRHARWSKMRRALAPRIFWLEPALSPALVALLVALAAPSTTAWQMAAFGLALQMACALAGHALLGARRPMLLAALEPVRVALALGAHLQAAASRRVDWRGHDFIIGEGSHLTRVARRSEARPRVGRARMVG